MKLIFTRNFIQGIDSARAGGIQGKSWRCQAHPHSSFFGAWFCSGIDKRFSLVRPVFTYYIEPTFGSW